MADKYRYASIPNTEARLLYASICEKTAARPGAELKYSATFGIDKENFDKIVAIEVEAIKKELGEFTSAKDYQLACISGETAAKRLLEAAEIDARGKSPDEMFKIKEKAEAKAALLRPYAGILKASSKFEVARARLDGGKIVDIPDQGPALAQAGKDYFYRGAWAAFAVEFQCYRRKTIDAKDGVTCYLQNVLFLRNGDRLGGAGPANSEVFGGFSGYSPVDPTALAPGGSEDEFASETGF